MARPVEYAQPRVDTKVRLTSEHARLLKEAQAERGLGRNRLIEMALDDFFHGKGVKPRLAKADPAKAPTSPPSKGTARHAPRVAQVGKGIQEASQEKASSVTPNFKESAQKSRVTPRSRRIVR